MSKRLSDLVKVTEQATDIIETKTGVSRFPIHKVPRILWGTKGFTEFEADTGSSLKSTHTVHSLFHRPLWNNKQLKHKDNTDHYSWACIYQIPVSESADTQKCGTIIYTRDSKHFPMNITGYNKFTTLQRKDNINQKRKASKYQKGSIAWLLKANHLTPISSSH